MKHNARPAQPLSAPGKDADARGNLLGLSRAQLDDLLAKMNGAAEHDAADSRRKFTRLPFDNQATALSIEHPGGGRTAFTVVCRNISRGGVAVLHTAYQHLGCRCRVILHHATQGPTAIEASIVRCRHVMRHIHELGIKFDHPINLSEFVPIDALSQQFCTEHVDAERLSGRLLLVSASRIDREVVTQALEPTQVELEIADTPERARRLAPQGFDAILLDLEMPSDEDAGDLLGAVAEVSNKAALIVMSADTSPAARERVRARGGHALLPQPLDETMFLRALTDMLLLRVAQRDAAGQGTAAESGAANFAWLFIEDVRAMLADLKRARDAGAAATMRALALKLRCVAPAMGFQSLGAIAANLVMALDATPRDARALPQAQALIDACERMLARAA